jgi:hypothetical protein
MDIKSVFDASSKSVWQFLCENGQGLYVPPYQRQYSWSAQNIKRLFEDISHGLALLVTNPDSVTFLGTIIAIHDKNLLTVQPIVKKQTPSCVMSIIDGQQRLTTLLMINMCLYDEMRTRFNKLDDGSVETKWLADECRSLMPNIQKTFEEDMNHGNSRYYPRMIRAYEDCWSRDIPTAKYTSPLANFINNFGRHIRSDSFQLFQYSIPDGIEDVSRFEFLINARKEIQKNIREVFKTDGSEFEYPSNQQLLNSENLIETLFDEIPKEVEKKMLSSDYKNYSELFRLVMFAHFFIERVAMTVVTASNEDYAFDMFESLNTTGEPLTAFETFKPKIIDTEGLAEYELSDSRTYCNTIENYLESFIKLNDKQDATANLLVTFALTEHGEKLSKRLGDQRRYFKKYEKLDKPEKKLFLLQLADVANFLAGSWDKDSNEAPQIEGIKNLSDDTKLCLFFLKKIKHTITQPLIIRYFSAFSNATIDTRSLAESSLVEVIKAITAFHILWRGSRHTTDGIDTIYRSLMSNGYPDLKVPPMKRSGQDKLPSADLLKTVFRDILAKEGGISNVGDWTSRLSIMPTYKNAHLAQLILLAASDDAVVDANLPGLIVKGRTGLMPMFTFEKFISDDVCTVEHIAPQNPSSADNWDVKIYDSPDMVDSIGNLTLLPALENSYLGNSGWAKKRLIYKILSAETQGELDDLVQQAHSQDISISESSEKLLERSKYLPLVRSIGEVEMEWTADLITKRSKRIGELAWDRVTPWLGY